MEAEVLGTAASTEPVATSDAFRVGPFDDPDRYEIGEPVEAGAEGILYRGQLVTPTSRLSLPVAVKALQPAYAGRIDQWAARWRDQVELLRSLQIPGLVGVREGFVGPLPHHQGAEMAGRNLYLVMNWVEGETLDHWVLRHRGVDIRNALKLLLPVAVAVDTMHGGQLTGSVPVVHRDIKPANILIGKSGSVLVDFGLTKGLSIGQPVGRAGTPGYIAPEVVAGGGYTPAADRYAFGATVFFLLTGRHPSSASKPAELRHVLETSPIGGGTGNAGIPSELVERVVAMLDPDPERRPAALANWIAQLRQSSLDDEVLSARLAPPAPARPRQRLGAEAAAAGAAVDPWAPAGSGRSAAPAAGGVGGETRVGGGTPVGAGAGGGFGSTVGAAAQAELTWGAPAPVTATDKGDTAGGTVGAAQRRGGAHRAPHRSRLHARPQQTAARRRALVVMLAVALTIVASDAGAGARPTRRPSRLLVLPATGNGTSGPFAVVSPPSGTDGGGTHNGAGTPSLGPLAQGANAASGKPGEAPTTTPSMPCVKSFVASCGPMVWSPPVNNKPLTVTFSYFPQHPMPGQQVTFNVVLEDPDDTNLGINGEYFGDAAGAGAAAAGTASTPGPSCPTFHGSWPPPGPGAKGHNELQVRHTYGSPGAYDVYFTASSGRVGGTCDLPDPYASAGMSAVVRVVVDPLPPPPTTTILTTTTTTPPPPTDTTTTAPSGNP